VKILGVGELPSEGIARLIEKRREVTVGWTPKGVNFTSIRYTGVEGLPEDFKESNDIYIVSRPVAEYLHLPHIVSPDKYIRDEKGQVIGCEGLCWFPPV
jgi:hypothetical protein